MDRRFGSKSLCFLRVLLLHPSLGIMIRLLTINSRGFDSQKEGFVFSLTKSCDFCFVQETFLNDTQGPHAPASRWTGSRFWSPVLGRQGGVAILVDPNFDGQILTWRKDAGGRILSLLALINGAKLNLINIYAPTNPTNQKVLFENLHEFFLPADSVIIGGDFNCYERDSDKFGGNVSFSLAHYLSDFRSALNLVDIWRKINPRTRKFTCLILTFLLVLAWVSF